MSDKFEGLKKGDRIRVVSDNVVEWVHKERIYVTSPDEEYDAWMVRDDPNIISVEKLEPPVPVEVFKAGDVVVSEGGSRYHILSDGYVDGIFYYPWDDFVGRDAFTSERYTKVELVEKPF